MMNIQQRKANTFKRKYKIRNSTLNHVVDALEKQGYTIILFNGVHDNDDVKRIIQLLDLEKLVNQNKCFTYRNERYRLVFLHEDLTEEEKRIALAHEEGHIWNGHMMQKNVFGEDILQEYEANEFAHYLLKNKKEQKLIIFIVIAILFLLGVFASLRIKNHNMVNADESQFYITDTGNKYHTKDCKYVRGKEEVYPISKSELQSGRYEPCNICKPNKK